MKPQDILDSELIYKYDLIKVISNRVWESPREYLVKKLSVGDQESDFKLISDCDDFFKTFVETAVEISKLELTDDEIALLSAAILMSNSKFFIVTHKI